MSIFLSLLLLFFTAPVSPSSSPDSYTKSLPSYHKPREYLELGLPCPLPSDFLVPSCSKQILRHSFTNSINAPPFSTHYSAPSNCLSPSSDCLDFGLFQPFRSVSVAGRYDPFRPKSVISADSAQITLIQHKSTRVVEKKKKHVADAAGRGTDVRAAVSLHVAASCRVRHGCGPSNGESVLPTKAPRPAKTNIF